MKRVCAGRRRYLSAGATNAAVRLQRGARRGLRRLPPRHSAVMLRCGAMHRVRRSLPYQHSTAPQQHRCALPVPRRAVCCGAPRAACCALRRPLAPPPPPGRHKRAHQQNPRLPGFSTAFFQANERGWVAAFGSAAAWHRGDERQPLSPHTRALFCCPTTRTRTFSLRSLISFSLSNSVDSARTTMERRPTWRWLRRGRWRASSSAARGKAPHRGREMGSFKSVFARPSPRRSEPARPHLPPRFHAVHPSLSAEHAPC